MLTTRIVEFAGRQTIEGTADGDARPQGQLHDPRAEPLHPDCRGVRRIVYRRALRAGGLPGRDRLRHRHLARRHDHIPVLRDLR